MKVILDETLKKKGISRYKLAKTMGVSVCNMNNLCNNQTKRIEFSLMDKICEALDCEVEDILQRERKDT